jgi:hypothetical protein
MDSTSYICVGDYPVEVNEGKRMGRRENWVSFRSIAVSIIALSMSCALIFSPTENTAEVIKLEVFYHVFSVFDNNFFQPAENMQMLDAISIARTRFAITVPQGSVPGEEIRVKFPGAQAPRLFKLPDDS